jgi:hypothetical protein
LAWNALILLSSPTMPVPARWDMEARIVAGESVGGPDIVRARQAHAAAQGNDGTVIIWRKPVARPAPATVARRMAA